MIGPLATTNSTTYSIMISMDPKLRLAALYLIQLTFSSCMNAGSQSDHSTMTGMASSLPIRVISYNIRYDNPGDSLNAWVHRKEMVTGLLKFHRADLVGIQEGLQHQVQFLAEALPGFGWCGVGRDDGKQAGEFSAIFYRQSRFKLLRDSTFWLSPTPAEISVGWDAAMERICTWAQFKDKVSGQLFFVFNTHFDHRGEKAREESARLLLKQIQRLARTAPVVLTGDFNTPENSVPYRILTGKQASIKEGAALLDAYFLAANAHHGALKTFSGFMVKEGLAGERIDYVFVKGAIEVTHHGILTDSRNDRYPSDHLPVLAEVVIQ